MKICRRRICWFIYTCLTLTVCCCSFFKEGFTFEWHVLVATTLDIQQVRKRWRCSVANLLHLFISASTFKRPFVLEIGYTYLIPFFYQSIPISSKKSEDQWKNGFLNGSGMCARCEHFLAIKKLGIIYAAYWHCHRTKFQERNLNSNETREVLHKAHRWWVIVRHRIE